MPASRVTESTLHPPIPQMSQNLIRLRARPDTNQLGRGRTMLVTGLDGFVSSDRNHGLFVEETRLLSRYRLRIEDRPLYPVTMSNIEQHSWLGYYIAPGVPGNGDESKLSRTAQRAVELRLSRRVAHGLREHIDLTNFAQIEVQFRLVLEIESDFEDQNEMRGRRQQFGDILTNWLLNGNIGELRTEYRAVHHYSHQDECGTAEICRGIAIRFTDATTPPSRAGQCIFFDIALQPHETWHCTIDHEPFADEAEPARRRTCLPLVRPSAENGDYDRRTEAFVRSSTKFESANDVLTGVVMGTLAQGKRDLAALRLFDLDRGDDAWTVAGGIPDYIALFGRDTLIAAWEAAPIMPDLMRGTLPTIAQHQGLHRNDWRDEESGRMLHEMHTGPLAALNYTPQGLYYGSATASALFPFVLAQFWYWTADRELTGSMLEPALSAIAWLDDNRKRNGGHFNSYQTRSQKGMRNQGWKDSDDAIVYEDGSLVPTPISTCEEQGYVYASKMGLAEVLRAFDQDEQAGILAAQATELKKRFNEEFWMEPEGYFAMALDPDQRQVRSIASDPLHCVATGIVDDALVPPVLDRLFKMDMFSGWGVRTLSSAHPSFNPYAYHRGTVWPAEHGPFALGAYRYGHHDQVGKICRGQFELASLFDYYRLPECICGHQRDLRHPFPALYPEANSPQAWSATTGFMLLQSILGLQPFAPLRILFLDPHLPDWLPELTIEDLRIGDARVSIRFIRTANGTSEFEVLRMAGNLRIVRQSSSWPVADHLGKFARDI